MQRRQYSLNFCPDRPISYDSLRRSVKIPPMYLWARLFMHTYETSEIKLYILKNGSEPIQSVNKKLHISNKSFYLLKKDYIKEKNKRINQSKSQKLQ